MASSATKGELESFEELLISSSESGKCIRETWHECQCHSEHRPQQTHCRLSTLEGGRPIMKNDQVFGHVVDVDEKDDNYQILKHYFQQARLSLVCVGRVENYDSLLKFCVEERNLRRHAEKVEVKQLFHVTSAQNIDDVFSSGFDQRLSKSGLFGRGIYFSDDPRKCDRYFRQRDYESHDIRYMLCCRVLLGDMKSFPAGDTHRHLQKEPEGHFAVKGRVGRHGFDEYVIYHGGYAYIEYIIGYRNMEPRPYLWTQGPSLTTATLSTAAPPAVSTPNSAPSTPTLSGTPTTIQNVVTATDLSSSSQNAHSKHQLESSALLPSSSSPSSPSSSSPSPRKIKRRLAESCSEPERKRKKSTKCKVSKI